MTSAVLLMFHLVVLNLIYEVFTHICVLYHFSNTQLAHVFKIRSRGRLGEVYHGYWYPGYARILGQTQSSKIPQSVPQETAFFFNDGYSLQINILCNWLPQIKLNLRTLVIFNRHHAEWMFTNNWNNRCMCRNGMIMWQWYIISNHSVCLRG